MRLVIDTNIIRCVGAGDHEVDGLRLFRDEGGSIHVADGAAVELVRQVSSGALPWSHWSHAKSLLCGLIDTNTPVLLGGRQLLEQEGVVRPTTFPEYATNDTVDPEIPRTLWKLLTNATRPSDLGTHSDAISAELGTGIARLDAEASLTLSREQQSEWAEMFERTKTTAADLGIPKISPSDQREALEQLTRQIGANIDEQAGNPDPPLSTRLDAMLRVQIMLMLRSMQKKNAYNAVNDANDVFDHDLLRYLALPAAICTNDGGIHRDLHSAHTWQASWAVRYRDLLVKEVRTRLLRLEWPVSRK